MSQYYAPKFENIKPCFSCLLFWSIKPYYLFILTLSIILTLLYAIKALATVGNRWEVWRKELYFQAHTILNRNQVQRNMMMVSIRSHSNTATMLMHSCPEVMPPKHPLFFYPAIILAICFPDITEFEFEKNHAVCIFLSWVFGYKWFIFLDEKQSRH